jgi:NADH dehydrogenase [ubiquinone] 1 alpha subcomplex assembly factor 7
MVEIDIMVLVSGYVSFIQSPNYGGLTIQAFRNHKIVDVFQEPGSADLTANVDFGYLRESLSDTARGLGPISQSNFLLSLGMEPRLQKLLDSASTPERKEDIRKAGARLIDPLGMGTQYQVMGVVPEGQKDVYPFDK